MTRLHGYFNRIILALAFPLALPVALASSSDCGTWINTPKTDFLRALQTNGIAISQTLHQCIEDNFCATYTTGTAPCLPTLYNYAADAAYYAGVLQRLTTNASQITQAAPAAQTTFASPPTTATATAPNAETVLPPSKSDGLYENIQF